MDAKRFLNKSYDYVKQSPGKIEEIVDVFCICVVLASSISIKKKHQLHLKALHTLMNK